MKMFVSGQIVDVLVDDEDMDLLHDYHWKLDRDGYLVNGRSFSHKNLMLCSLHREVAFRIFGNTPDKHVVDHANRIKIDNRRNNLRLATYSQNSFNTTKRSRSKSGFRGVHIDRYGRYKVSIKISGISYYFGTFMDPVDAARVYDREAKLLLGEFAILNFPMLVEPTEQSAQLVP